MHNFKADLRIRLYAILKYVFSNYFIMYATEHALDIVNDMQYASEESGMSIDDVSKMYIGLTQIQVGLGKEFKPKGANDNV